MEKTLKNQYCVDTITTFFEITTIFAFKMGRI